MLRVEARVVRLNEDPHKRIWAKILYGCAFAFGVPSVLAAAWVHAGFWWGMLFAISCSAAGFIVGAAERETRFDFERKRVFRGERGMSSDGISFEHLLGVAAFAETILVRMRENTHEVRRFGLGLLVADGAASLREVIAAMRRDRMGAVRDVRAPAVHELAPRLEQRVRTHALVVADSTDETLVWQAAEWLARKLDLPLIDACTSPMQLRVPEELDLPLGERLARGLQGIDAPAAYASSTVPSGASIERRRDKCTLSWRRNHWSNLLLFGGVMLLFPGMALLLDPEQSVAFWACSALGLTLLPLLVLAAQWHGINRIAVGRKHVVVTRGPWGSRLPALATDSVEAVRIGGTNEHPLLTLISDRRVLRLPMDPPLARWAKQHIERHLRSTYAKELKRPVPDGEAGAGR